MRKGLLIVTVFALLVILTPVLIDYIALVRLRTEVPRVQTSIPTTVAEYTNRSVKVIELGCGESHQGADRLVVCPSEVKASSPGVVVEIKATVYFRHRQPCPYSGWRIVVENLVNARLVNESDVRIEENVAYKSFFVEVLGNGSVDVVFYYGPGCPYGTEERVKVVFTLSQNITEQSSNEAEVVNVSIAQEGLETKSVEGVVELIDVSTGSIVVDGTHVVVKGRWVCDSEELNWR